LKLANIKPKTPTINNKRNTRTVAIAIPIFPPIFQRVFYEKAPNITSNHNEWLGFVGI
jgi:hypothetical protein